MASDNGSTIHISELVPDPKNARQHTPRGLGMIEDSLQEVGAARSIVIDENNRILAGNQTTEAAANVGLEDVMIVDAPGDKLVAVRRSNLTEQQKTRLALWDNRSAEVATWSSEMLAKMQQEDEALLQGLFRADELEAILGDLAQEPVADPGAQIDRAAELQEKWQVERGQIWQIGRHRLMCGDSTSAEDVGRLMGGEKAQAVVSDPPYGVGVEYGEFQDNEASAIRLVKLFMPIIQGLNVPIALTPGIPVMCHYPCPSWLMVWVHPAPSGSCPWGFAGTNPILVYGKDPYLEAGLGRRPDSISMAADRQHVDGHPTPKPLKVWTWLVERMTTATGQTVLDIFLGSGTTLVACEQTGRIGYGMEIEPKYCAVTLERLTGMGLKARRA
jgi:hypothetical protein